MPFENLEKNDQVDLEKYKSIHPRFIHFFRQAKAFGYNAVTLDDVAHLADFDFYPPEINQKIIHHKKHFQSLFRIAKDFGMKIFLTTDVMFYNRYIHQITGNSFQKRIGLLKTGIEKLFVDFSEVDGIIFRIGESDGLDVKSDFKSRLIVKSPSHIRGLLKKLIPLFENNKKLLIFRTWTIGAHACGDLIWNQETFIKTFRGFSSKSLIISMKYGNADFFRYLKLNPLFYKTRHRKIIEFQAKREYEGFGTYPSFIGWDIHRYMSQVKNIKSIIGMSVWCQTGGWSRKKNLTFLKSSTFWNELNTFCTIQIVKKNHSVRKSIRYFIQHKKLDIKLKTFIRFLKYSEKVIKNILYDPEFSGQDLYFNRVKLPPLIHIFWNHITVNQPIIELFHAFVKSEKISVKRAKQSFKLLRDMKEIASQCNLPYDADYHRQTFYLLCQIRKLIYLNNKDHIYKRLISSIEKYRIKYPDGYQFNIFEGLQKSSLPYRILIKIFVRNRPAYRLIDHLLFSKPVTAVILFLLSLNRKVLPDFVNSQAMPLKSFL